MEENARSYLKGRGTLQIEGMLEKHFMMQPSPIESQLPQLGIDLASLSGYESFGAMLKTIRTRHNVTQQQFAEMSKPYFRSRKLQTLTFRICSALEIGRLRAPHFEELEALYLTLTGAEGFNISLSPKERELFVLLARKRIEEKQKQKEHIDPEQWDKLADRLADLDGSRRSKIYLLPKPEGLDQARFIEPEDSRRLRAIHDALHTDTSHLLERDAWLEHMVSYLTREQQRKLVVIQGHMGIGKSHALALLTQHLASLSDYYLIPYRFSSGEGKTPEDQLDTFLATLQADLLGGTSITDTMKQPPLAERMEQVFSTMKQRGKVVLLLDDVQEVFSSATQWPTVWEQFFLAFVKEPHTSTMFLASRLWPGWPDRRLTYIEETELPSLSPESCVRLWKRAGFSDVPEQLLHQVSERYGGNPQVIDMKANSLKRPGFTLSWQSKRRHDLLPSNTQENEHTRLIKKLLSEDAIFTKTDISSRKMLTQVITGRLSHQATRMLEMLAVSPLGIPFSLLDEEFRDFEIAYDELVRTSLVDLSMAASDRAAAAPLVREAQVHALLNDGRKEGIEQRVTDLYILWLNDLQDFRDDAEKSALIAEMVVRHIRQGQLLKAAELFISYGWLCTLFGHITRIQRVFDEYVKDNRGKTEEAKNEVGRLLLSYHIALRIGQKISGPDSEHIYQEIYDNVIAGNLTLQPHMEIDVLHNMMLKYLRLGFFQEASQVFDETLARIRQSGQGSSEVYASYLHSKSRLFARWSEAKKRDNHLDDAQRLLLACVDTLKESIHQWRQCLKKALPLQEHYISFKLARALNDYAYRQRLLGNLLESQEAIEESIRLKKASAALPHSVAISLSEYSQVLAAQGHNRQALDYNGEAVSIMERAIEDGNTTLNSELGMLLIERADIYQQQARLAEAKQLLERAVELIVDKRKSFREKAESQIKEIRIITETTQHYQLDKKWFARYHDLTSFDDLAWHAHAGPFTDEEQEEWNSLYPRRNEKEISDRTAALIVQSRQREFTRSQEEHHAPTLYYPMIPLDEVQHRITGFEQLQKEIDTQESNAIVRALYTEAIWENLTLLHQCEATALRDQGAVWRGHLDLYGKPETQEMMIALQPFCSMLLRAQQHEQAGPLAQGLLAQFRSWGLSPEELAAIHPLIPKLEAAEAKLQAQEKQTFSHEVVRRFFQDVFAKEYHTTEWHVAIAPARDYTYVDIDSRTVFLPPRSLTVDKVRDLLAEEIEVHAYRSMSGQRSPLALLSSGLAKYKTTEEGLANHYVQQVSLQMHGKSKSKSWISTLCIGLACGVMTPQHSFIELCDFLEKAFLANRLYTEGDETREEMLAEARDEAWTRVARIFRGIPNLNEKGICSLRDRIYLQGYMDVLHYLEQREEQRLFVGKTKIEDLDMLAELNILTPYYPHQHLALDPHLLERLSQYKQKST